MKYFAGIIAGLAVYAFIWQGLGLDLVQRIMTVAIAMTFILLAYALLKLGAP